MEDLLRFRSITGVQHDITKDACGNLHDRTTQDIGPILDRNKAMATHNDGYSQTREFRRVASIPTVVQFKMIERFGADPLARGNEDLLVRVLNDPDFRYLRTAPGYIGYKNDTVR